MSTLDATPPDSDAVFHGVDFSGGESHARKIWVSSWTPGEVAGIEGGFSHRDLRDEIAASAGDGRRHYWLLDATFGLPLEMLQAHEVLATWEDAAAWLASFDSPRDWRRSCRARSRKEPRRLTDQVAKTPFAPSNLRMFKQTWHSIVSVLVPLSRLPDVAILPFAVSRATPGSRESSTAWSVAPVWVGEGCPAVSLREAEWPHKGYKGPTPRNRELRVELLDRLGSGESIRIAEENIASVVDDPEADALDSLLLLPAVRRFSQCDHDDLVQREPRVEVEGWVYP